MGEGWSWKGDERDGGWLGIYIYFFVFIFFFMFLIFPCLKWQNGIKSIL